MDTKLYGDYTPINNIWDYSLSLIFGTISSTSNKEMVKNGVIDGDYKYLDKNVISIVSPTDISLLNFNYTEAQIITLLKNGYFATQNYFSLRHI